VYVCNVENTITLSNQTEWTSYNYKEVIVHVGGKFRFHWERHF